jgi:hypothetical protein
MVHLWPGEEFPAARIPQRILAAAAGVFTNLYLASYILSPKSCHSFVGYLEEEAVKTYTRAIKASYQLTNCQPVERQPGRPQPA